MSISSSYYFQIEHLANFLDQKIIQHMAEDLKRAHPKQAGSDGNWELPMIKYNLNVLVFNLATILIFNQCVMTYLFKSSLKKNISICLILYLFREAAAYNLSKALTVAQKVLSHSFMSGWKPDYVTLKFKSIEWVILKNTWNGIERDFKDSISKLH